MGDSLTIVVAERYIALQVNTISKPKVYYHNDGYFLVRSVNLDDRNEVLYSGPQMLNTKPVIIKVLTGMLILISTKRYYRLHLLVEITKLTSELMVECLWK